MTPNSRMKRSASLVILICSFIGCGFQSVRAANSGAAEDYSQIARQRAEKITAALAMVDSAKLARAQETIARQYRDLNAIQQSRDREVSEAKTLSDRATSEAKVIRAKETADAAVNALHTDFLGRLAVDLTPAQIDQVKDGMTYGVLPLTFRVYQQMLPNLTPEQKQQILAWLTEAREHAMDGGTSKEKHAWFGKYKGRINNYLSAAGIDMKAAEKNLGRHSDAVEK